MKIIKKITKIFGIVIISFICVYCMLVLISFVVTKPIAQHSWYQQKVGEHTPLILAHQGGEGEFPSNTKLSFTEAASAGADVLDTDVHVTKDGIIVLAHDDDLDHRTNGKGLLEDKTLAELQDIDFAYNWSQDGGTSFPYRGKGLGVYTLEELINDFPNKRFGIEIKSAKQNLPQMTCDIIKKHQIENSILISSTIQADMDAFRSFCPAVATSATPSETTKFYIFQRLGLAGLYTPKFSSFQIPEKSGSITVMTKWFSSNSHKKGIKIYNWTIDTPEQTKHFVDLGADGVNTSYPSRIIKSLKR